MTDNTDLIIPIELDHKQAVAFFTKADEFEKLFARIKEQTDSHAPDISTSKGRDEIRSLAHKVTRTKTTLDALGKAVKEDAQKTVDAVDSTRRKMREQMDALKDQVRKPLTEYEAEEARKDQEVNSDLATLANLKMVPFNASIDRIQSMQSHVQQLAMRNDWRGHEEKAQTLIDACMTIHKSALESARERARIEAENEKLKLEQKRLEEEKAKDLAKAKAESDKLRRESEELRRKFEKRSEPDRDEPKQQPVADPTEPDGEPQPPKQTNEDKIRQEAIADIGMLRIVSEEQASALFLAIKQNKIRHIKLYY